MTKPAGLPEPEPVTGAAVVPVAGSPVAGSPVAGSPVAGSPVAGSPEGVRSPVPPPVPPPVRPHCSAVVPSAFTKSIVVPPFASLVIVPVLIFPVPSSYSIILLRSVPVYSTPSIENVTPALGATLLLT